MLMLAFVLMPAIADAQTTADFFDSQVLQEVQVFINSRDLKELRENYWENRYYPADFVWRGVRTRNVGVRVRGLSTRSATKPGLRIEFDHYITGQQFLGLHSLVLDNVLRDPAFIRERTAMAFIDHMGQPALRESFGRVYINGVYHGVYAFMETVDTNFLKRTLGESSGYLFEFKFTAPFHGEDLGDNLDEYKAHFQAETRQREPDSVLYSPFRDLFREVNHDVDSMWRERVGQYIDLQQLVMYVALETFLAEDDGFLGYAGLANFYLYRPAGQNVHRLLAWDRDSTFQAIDWSIFPRVEENILVQRALSFSDLRSTYLDVLEQCARAAIQDAWLDNEVSRVSALIADAVHADPLKLSSNDEYDAAAGFLREFAQRRAVYVLDEVAKARAQSDGRAR